MGAILLVLPTAAAAALFRPVSTPRATITQNAAGWGEQQMAWAEQMEPMAGPAALRAAKMTARMALSEQVRSAASPPPPARTAAERAAIREARSGSAGWGRRPTAWPEQPAPSPAQDGYVSQPQAVKPPGAYVPPQPVPRSAEERLAQRQGLWGQPTAIWGAQQQTAPPAAAWPEQPAPSPAQGGYVSQPQAVASPAGAYVPPQPAPRSAEERLAQRQGLWGQPPPVWGAQQQTAPPAAWPEQPAPSPAQGGYVSQPQAVASPAGAYVPPQPAPRSAEERAAQRQGAWAQPASVWGAEQPPPVWAEQPTAVWGAGQPPPVWAEQPTAVWGAGQPPPNSARAGYASQQQPVASPTSAWTSAPAEYGAESPLPGREKEYEAFKAQAFGDWTPPEGYGEESPLPGREKEYEEFKAHGGAEGTWAPAYDTQPPIDEERRSRSPGIANNFFDRDIADFKRPHGMRRPATSPVTNAPADAATVRTTAPADRPAAWSGVEMPTQGRKTGEAVTATGGGGEASTKGAQAAAKVEEDTAAGLTEVLVTPAAKQAVAALPAAKIDEEEAKKAWLSKQHVPWGTDIPTKPVAEGTPVEAKLVEELTEQCDSGDDVACDALLLSREDEEWALSCSARFVGARRDAD